MARFDAAVEVALRGVEVRRLGAGFRVEGPLDFLRPELGRRGGGVLTMGQSYQRIATFGARLA